MKPGDKSPTLTLPDEKEKIAGTWVKVSPKDTVPKALEALGGKPYLNGRRD